MVMWHGGIASSRRVAWAERIAREHPHLLDQPWPPLAGRAAAKTLAKVTDLGHEDLRLIKQLVEEVAESAARRWEELRGERRG